MRRGLFAERHGANFLQLVPCGDLRGLDWCDFVHGLRCGQLPGQHGRFKLQSLRRGLFAERHGANVLQLVPCGDLRGLDRRDFVHGQCRGQLPGQHGRLKLHALRRGLRSKPHGADVVHGVPCEQVCRLHWRNYVLELSFGQHDAYLDGPVDVYVQRGLLQLWRRHWCLACVHGLRCG